jgi:hypothetical protein
MLSIRALVACVPILFLAAPVQAEEPSREELLEQLRELQQRVEQLEQRQQEQAAGPDAGDVDRVVTQVIADAERRSQLLMQDVALTAGFDLQRSKFFVRSADGNFLLMPGFLFQFRNVTNFRTDTEDDDDITHGFDVRRMRLIFDGNVFSPEWIYKFQWESNFDGGNVFLLDAWLRHVFRDTNWAVQAGQFKDIPFHEFTMADEVVTGVDRSLIGSLIGGGQSERLQGVMLMYDDRQHWRGQVLLHDGYNSDNTDFTDNAGGTSFIGVTPTNFGVSARLEHFFSGTRQSYDQFTALGTTEDLLVVGGGANWSQGGDSDVIFHTVDLQYENPGGLGLYGALHGLWREIGAGDPVPAGSYYDWGFLVQGSYLFTRSLEGFARYNLTLLDGDALAAGAEDTVHEITVGGTYYFHRHNVKFTLDFNWLPNGVPIPVRGLGYLAGDDDQFIIRAQLQLFL